MISEKSNIISIFTKQVKDFISDDFITFDLDHDLKEAVSEMQKQKKHTIVVTKQNKIHGIITDKDLVEKLLYKEDSFSKVKDIMSSPAVDVSQDDLLFHAVGKMNLYGFRHLPVSNVNDEPIGILYIQDALFAELGNVGKQINNLQCKSDELGIIELKHKQVQLAEELIKGKYSPHDISFILSFLNLVIYRRSIRLAVDRVGKQKIINDIPNYCVIVMGSGGRMESFMHPDQDNGLIYEVPDGADEKKIDQYFSALAKEFTIILDKADIPLCKGDLMATNPLWRKSIQKWKSEFDDWVNKADDMTLRYIDMLYDFMPAYGDSNLSNNLREHVLKKLKNTPSFLKYLYKRDQETNAGVGWFNRFILEKEKGENFGLLNLKHTGTLPLVEATRMYAIKHLIKEVSTFNRMNKLTELNVFTQDENDFFKSAHTFIAGVLIKNQIQQIKNKQPVKNYIDPNNLSMRETKILKLYLREIRKLKERLRSEFTGEYY
ncbi:MAG: DUF294 nucleotidyltransferase-like domain-containing protein [Pelagibacteraceae bacterium]